MAHRGIPSTRGVLGVRMRGVALGRVWRVIKDLKGSGGGQTKGTRVAKQLEPTDPA